MTYLESDATGVLVVDGDVKEDFWVSGLWSAIVSDEFRLCSALRSDGSTSAARRELGGLVAGTCEHVVFG